jgi:hypothetical protein
VVLVPDPVVPPGFSVQVPDGRPFRVTLPVATEQLGCITDAIWGAGGVPGLLIITTSAVSIETHPASLVTLKRYVFGIKLDMVIVLPVPVIAPGLIVHVPEGNPLNCTLPVATEQEGCITASTLGTEGVTGLAIITALADASDVHPAELVTV